MLPWTKERSPPREADDMRSTTPCIRPHVGRKVPSETSQRGGQTISITTAGKAAGTPGKGRSKSRIPAFRDPSIPAGLWNGEGARWRGAASPFAQRLSLGARKGTQTHAPRKSEQGTIAPPGRALAGREKCPVPESELAIRGSLRRLVSPRRLDPFLAAVSGPGQRDKRRAPNIIFCQLLSRIAS